MRSSKKRAATTATGEITNDAYLDAGAIQGAFNMIGNLVMVKNIANNQSTLNIENLTNGVYFMELNLSNGSILNSKFIKK